MKKGAILVVLILALVAVGAVARVKYHFLEAGKNYTFINQTNVLVNYMYGECGPASAGDLYGNDKVTIFVKDGTRTKVSFRGHYGAPYCHCYSPDLVGAASGEETIVLTSKTFCDK